MTIFEEAKIFKISVLEVFADVNRSYLSSGDHLSSSFSQFFVETRGKIIQFEISLFLKRNVHCFYGLNCLAKTHIVCKDTNFVLFELTTEYLLVDIF